MPRYSYTIKADHPVLARIDKVVWMYGTMIRLKNDLIAANYDNISIVQTDSESDNQISLPIK